MKRIIELLKYKQAQNNIRIERLSDSNPVKQDLIEENKEIPRVIQILENELILEEVKTYLEERYMDEKSADEIKQLKKD
jgi:hypothetical protein